MSTRSAIALETGILNWNYLVGFMPFIVIGMDT
jgi:hypothetical protein